MKKASIMIAVIAILSTSLVSCNNFDPEDPAQIVNTSEPAIEAVTTVTVDDNFSVMLGKACGSDWITIGNGEGAVSVYLTITKENGTSVNGSGATSEFIAKYCVASVKSDLPVELPGVGTNLTCDLNEILTPAIDAIGRLKAGSVTYEIEGAVKYNNGSLKQATNNLTIEIEYNAEKGVCARII